MQGKHAVNDSLEAAEMRRTVAKRYRTAMIWAGLFFIAALAFSFLGGQHRQLSATARLSDAILVPGLLLTCWGVLRIADYYGFYDAFFYGSKKFLSIKSRDKDTVEERMKRSMTLAEYIQDRDLKRVFPTHDFAIGIPLVLVSLALAFLTI